MGKLSLDPKTLQVIWIESLNHDQLCASWDFQAGVGPVAVLAVYLLAVAMMSKARIQINVGARISR